MNNYKLKEKLKENYKIELPDYVLIDTLLFFYNRKKNKDGIVKALPKTICEELFYKGDAKNSSRFLKPMIKRLKDAGLLTEQERDVWTLGEEALKLYAEFYQKPAISAIKAREKANKWLYSEGEMNCSIIDAGVCKSYASLEHCLKDIPKSFKKDIEAVRSLPYKSEEYNKAKAKIPCFTPSCRVEYGKTASKENIKNANGIICIDIDGVDNDVSPEEMKKRLSSLPFVWIVQNSISDKGVFVIVKIDIKGNTYERVSIEFKRYYKAISEEILNATGLKVDMQCSNVNRLRTLSYDEKPYRNNEACTYSLDGDVIIPVKKDNSRVTPSDAWLTRRQASDSALTEYELKRFQRNMEKLDKENIQITHDHEESRNIGRSLANVFGESGRKYYHIIRSKKPNYDEIKTDERYNEYLADGMSDGYGIGTFYYYFNKYKIL